MEVSTCLYEISYETFLDPIVEPCFYMQRTVLLLRVCVSSRSFHNTFSMLIWTLFFVEVFRTTERNVEKNRDVVYRWQQHYSDTHTRVF